MYTLRNDLFTACKPQFYFTACKQLCQYGSAECYRKFKNGTSTDESKIDFCAKKRERLSLTFFDLWFL